MDGGGGGGGEEVVFAEAGPAILLCNPLFSGIFKLAASLLPSSMHLPSGNSLLY